MLQPEITPFAQAHIKELDAIVDRLQDILINPTTTPTEEEVVDWIKKLRMAGHGFERFRVCAEDEWKQKERYAKYAHENGYPYS